MCRWLAYCGSPIFLDELLFEPENSLIEQSLHARKAATAINGDGFGVGWYGERCKPGLFRDILPAWNDSNLKSVAHQIKSGLFFAHVRASTGTPVSRENCHPFSYKNWLFMHNGQIGEFHKVRRELEFKLDAALFPHRQGSTDSELIFLLLIQNGLETNIENALRLTIQQIEQVMADFNIEEPFRFTCCLSNGQKTVALRYANDNQAPSLYACNQNGQTFIASEPLNSQGDGIDWCAVAQGHCLCIQEGKYDVHPFMTT